MREVRARRGVDLFLLLLLLMPLSARPAHGAEIDIEDRSADVLGDRIPVFYRKALQLALENANRKLLRLSCQDVFSDFSDREGRLLAENLRDTGQSPAEYLQGIRFVDGRWSVPCMSSWIHAWTRPGSRVIHLCLDQFAVMARETPSAAGNILIHEELHALGLGENPPESRAITSRVTIRCGG